MGCISGGRPPARHRMSERLKINPAHTISGSDLGNRDKPPSRDAVSAMPIPNGANGLNLKRASKRRRSAEGVDNLSMR